MNEEQKQLEKLRKKFLEPESYDKLIHHVNVNEIKKQTIQKFKKQIKQNLLYETIKGVFDSDLEDIIEKAKKFNKEIKNKMNEFEKEEDEQFFREIETLHMFLYNPNYSFDSTDYVKLEYIISRDYPADKRQFPIPKYVIERMMDEQHLEETINYIRDYTEAINFDIETVYKKRIEVLEEEIIRYCSTLQTYKNKGDKLEIIFDSYEFGLLPETVDEYQNTIGKINNKHELNELEQNKMIVYNNIITTLNVLNNNSFEFQKKNEAAKLFIEYTIFPN